MREDARKLISSECNRAKAWPKNWMGSYEYLHLLTGSCLNYAWILGKQSWTLYLQGYVIPFTPCFDARKHHHCWTISFGQIRVYPPCLSQYLRSRYYPRPLTSRKIHLVICDTLRKRPLRIKNRFSYYCFRVILSWFLRL